MTARTAGMLVSLLVAAGSLSAHDSPLGIAHQVHEPAGVDLKFKAGVYYPRPYYSRAYLQDFVLEEGQIPLTIRLQPFDNYARFRLGTPIPNLTDGTVQSNVFPYRYDIRFEPGMGRRPADSMLPPKVLDILSMPADR